MARKVSTRQSNAPIPVVIGAGITEQWYFYHLHDILNVQLRIRPRYFGSEDIHQLDKKIAQVINEGATAICVFDADTAQVDEVQRQRIASLKAKYAGKKNVILCDSLPSIEFWFLIHYIDTNKHFPNAHAAERELRSFIAQYASEFSNLLPQAIEEYLDDNLRPDLQEQREKILEQIDLLEISTIDILKALVDEVNIHGSLPETPCLNIPVAKFAY